MRRIVVVGVALVLVVLGVGSASGAWARAAKPKRAATAELTFTGAVGLAGPVSAQVSCNLPSIVGGGTIFMLAQPAEPTAVFNMHVAKGKISVGVYSGSGTNFRGRDFEGAGVTGFDAAKGAHIDSKLTETTPSGENPGTLGAITSVKGSINCGDQTIGSSTARFSGATADGAIRGRAHPFRVECDTAASGNSVAFQGVATVGRRKALFITTFMPDAINIFESVTGPPPASRHYFVKAPGVSTLTSTGATFSGDAVEQSPTSGVPHTLHVAGKVTCGTTVHR